jgi:hypothetical protein
MLAVRRCLWFLPTKIFDIRLRECLRFLELCNCGAGREGNLIPISGAVDSVWHALVLQTDGYAELCARLGDGRFIHHSQIGETEKSIVAESVRRFASDLCWIAAYVRKYEAFEKASYKCWRAPSHLVSLGYSLTDVNLLGKEIADRFGPGVTTKDLEEFLHTRTGQGIGQIQELSIKSRLFSWLSRNFDWRDWFIMLREKLPGAL